MGGVLIAVTLLTSVSNAQPTLDCQQIAERPRQLITPEALAYCHLPVELHPLAKAHDVPYHHPSITPEPFTAKHPKLPSPHCRLQHRPHRIPPRCHPLLSKPKLARAFDAISRCSMNLASTAATSHRAAGPGRPEGFKPR